MECNWIVTINEIVLMVGHTSSTIEYRFACSDSLPVSLRKINSFMKERIKREFDITRVSSSISLVSIDYIFDKLAEESVMNDMGVLFLKDTYEETFHDPIRRSAY